jgi:hypothetical protein
MFNSAVKWNAMRTITLISLLAVLLLAACQSQPGGAVQAVEEYYQALVDRDDARFTGYTCAAWEEQALLEFDSFAGVKIKLEGLNCEEAGTEGNETLVACSGKIAATYGSEQMDFPLDGRMHRVVNENGDWRVCGY